MSVYATSDRAIPWPEPASGDLTDMVHELRELGDRAAPVWLAIQAGHIRDSTTLREHIESLRST